MKAPAFQFYPGDWLKDPAVTLCQPATRGVWMDLLCRMYESDRSGVLTGTRDQIARLGRCSTAELVLALDDLRTSKAADVTDRNGMVTVVCRRIKKAADERKNAALRQRNHRASLPRDGPVTPLSRGTSTSTSVQEYQTGAGEAWEIEARVRSWVGDSLGGNERMALVRHWQLAVEAGTVEIHGKAVPMTELVRVCVEHMIRDGFVYDSMTGFLKYLGSMQTRCRRQHCWPSEGRERKLSSPPTPRPMEGAH